MTGLGSFTADNLSQNGQWNLHQMYKILVFGMDEINSNDLGFYTSRKQD